MCPDTVPGGGRWGGPHHRQPEGADGGALAIDGEVTEIGVDYFTF
jgi:hypothetical protein